MLPHLLATAQISTAQISTDPLSTQLITTELISAVRNASGQLRRGVLKRLS